MKITAIFIYILEKIIVLIIAYVATNIVHFHFILTFGHRILQLLFVWNWNKTSKKAFSQE